MFFVASSSTFSSSISSSLTSTLLKKHTNPLAKLNPKKKKKKKIKVHN